MALVSLAIRHGNDLIYPTVHENIEWETNRKGSPSKLTFTIQQDDASDQIAEGDAVAFKYGESGNMHNIFYGFLFKREFDKSGEVKCTAYDQLRYFKNKHTYQYTNKRADQLVTMIAKDFALKTGTLEKTNYVIGSRLEDNQTLFDIVQNALDLTVMQTGSLYVLYDDYGKLTLKNISSMKVNLLFADDAAEDYSYTSSIDEETYNRIILYYDNDETNKRETYVKESTTTQKQWGVLQYTESLQSNSNANKKAEQLLSLYNRKTEKMELKGAFGDYRCRAGASIPVELDTGARKFSNYMVIDKAVHKFNLDEYTMDLTLIGSNVTA